MKPNLRFSLVIPCLSDPKILRQTLDSVAAQQFPLDRFEVIVVDDCSPASLESIVAHYQGETGGRATFLRNETNLGRASSRNHGIQVASGEILVFLDVDQILEPEYLSALDEEFGENLKQSIRGNLAVWPTLLESSAFLRFYNSRLLGQRSAKEMEAIDIARLPAKYWASTSMATGREAVIEAGAFDERFVHYGCEDEELGIKLEAANVPLHLSLRAKSYSADDGLTVRRACTRTIDYARFSVPQILELHPEYVTQLTGWFLEMPIRRLPFKYIPVRLAVGAGLRFWMVQLLLRSVERSDGRLGFNPPANLYKLLLLGHYLQGMRLRKRGQT